VTSNERNLAVFAAAIGLTLLASAAYLGVAGISDDNIRILLRASARLALVVLLLAFVARPLRQLLPSPASARLLANRRLIGIAFAGIHTAHAMLILYRAQQIPGFEFAPSASIPGLLTYGIIYLMLITSFDRPARAIGRKAWKVLHKAGLFWLVFAFAQTQLPDSLDNLSGVNWWLVALIVLALVIRMTAFFAKFQRVPG